MKLNTYIVFGLERNHVALKGFYKITAIKHQQNNDSVGVFNPVKSNHLKSNQIKIEKTIWIW